MTRATEQVARRSAGEAGFAIATSILVTIVLTMLIATAVFATDNATQRSRRDVIGVTGRAVIEMAVDKYQHALAGGNVGSSTGFAPTRTILVAVADGGVDDVRANGELPSPYDVVDGTVPVLGRYAVRERTVGGRTGWWQVYRITPPSASVATGRPTVSIYLRAWVTEGTDPDDVTGSPSFARVEYRAETFADLEMLIDGDVMLAPGTIIDGAIHSNGNDDGIAPHPWGQTTLWTEGDVTCTARASVRTAQGQPHMPPSCNVRPQDVPIRDFSTVDAVVATARQACASTAASTNIYCLRGPDVNEVRLDGSRMFIDGNAVAIPKSGASVVVYGNATVEGSTSRPVSVAALTPDDGRAGGTIRVIGDVGGNSEHIPGLIAEGDVIVDTAGCEVGSIDAAIIAVRGALTIDPMLSAPGGELGGSGSGFCDSELRLSGTIIAARAPRLLWVPEWDVTGNHGRVDPEIGEGAVGWATRRYSWDERVARTPPPLMPWSGDWEFSRWRSVNVDCLMSASEDPGCA